MSVRRIRNLVGSAMILFNCACGPAQAWQLVIGEQIVSSAGQVVTFTDYDGTAFTFDSKPVVFALVDSNPLTSGPIAVRIHNVTTTGFSASPMRPGREPVLLDSVPSTTSPVAIQYLAIEPGIHKFPDGSMIEAGLVTSQRSLPSDGAAAWSTINLQHAYTVATPVTLTEIQTNNGLTISPVTGIGSPWLTATAQNVSAVSMQVAMDGSAAYNGTLPVAEEIGWLAFEAAQNGEGRFIHGSGAFAVRIGGVSGSTNIAGTGDTGADPRTFDTSNCNTVNLPNTYTSVLAGKQSRNDPGGGWLRRCGTHSGTSAVPLAIDEDMNAGNSDRARSITDRVAVLAFAYDQIITLPTSPVGFAVSFDLVADYHLDACSLGSAGALIKDYSRFGLDGIGNGLSRINVQGETPPAPLCAAAGFAAVTSEVVVNDAPELDLAGALSIAAWVRNGADTSELYKTIVAKSTNAYRFLLERVCVQTYPGPPEVKVIVAESLCFNPISTDIAYEYLFSYEFTNGLGITLPTVQSVDIAAVSDVTANWDGTGLVPVGEWHHLAVTADGFNIKLYLDGVLIRDVPLTQASGINNNNLELSLGVSFNSLSGVSQDLMDGAVDEASLWNYALLVDDLRDDHFLRSRECKKCGRETIYWREIYQR